MDKLPQTFKTEVEVVTNQLHTTLLYHVLDGLHCTDG